MMEPLLEVEGLEVVYGRSIRAVQGVSLTIAPGQIVGLVGLNGAGKTTTIRAISGFLPTENVTVADGRIRFDGQSIRGRRPYQTARLGISVVAEREKVFDTLTVQENLALSLLAKSRETAGRAPSVKFRSISDILELFPSLGRRLEQKSVFLSGGERQMLAIGCCLLSSPRLLIVDEASLGLAPLIRHQVFDILRRLNRDNGLTILIVDQDVAGVLSISHHGYILENGRIAFAGESRSLLQHPDVKEFYLGTKEDSERGYKDVKQYRRGPPMALSGDTLLEAEGIRLSFGGLQVLQDNRLDVLSGKITALIGPNGAGKTAMLNCISGIYRPQAGHIRYQGRELIGHHPAEIAKIGIARSFQNLELFPSLTVLENLLVARDPHFRGSLMSAAFFFGAARRQEVRERRAAERVIDFFELWPVRNVRAHDLPYGQQKIVGFARAMAAEPKLLLLDEPGSGLTRDEKEDLARFILRLRHDWGVSILWIEHDLQMVMDLADRVHVFESGRNIASGTPAEVRRVPAVIEAYFGSAFADGAGVAAGAV